MRRVGGSLLLPTLLENRLRYAGLTLQLFGILAVVRNLHSRQRLFNRVGLCRAVSQWLARRPRRRTEHLTAKDIVAGSVSLEADTELTVWQKPRPDETVEKQIAALWQTIELLKTKHSDATLPQA